MTGHVECAKVRASKGHSQVCCSQNFSAKFVECRSWGGQKSSMFYKDTERNPHCVYQSYFDFHPYNISIITKLESV